MSKIEPFEVEYELYFTKAYLETRQVKQFYCIACSREDAVNEFKTYIHPQLIRGDVSTNIIRVR